MHALDSVRVWAPRAAQRVDFLHERSTKEIGRQLPIMYGDVATALRSMGRADLAEIAGSVVPPSGESTLPLQAADLLAWHIRGVQQGDGCRPVDIQRYRSLMNIPGREQKWSRADLTEFARRANRQT